MNTSIGACVEMLFGVDCSVVTSSNFRERLIWLGFLEEIERGILLKKYLDWK